MRPFRFGIMPYVGSWRHPMNEWVKSVKLYETLGYDTLFQCDHFDKTIYDPIAMLASAAVTTEKLHIGTLVFDVDYRHPVVLAKAAATLHLLSNGRYEFGIGAGWQKRDYHNAGIKFDRPSKRIERLEEALKIIRGMWTQENTSFDGNHYQINEIDRAGNLSEGEYPKIIVGGGGKKVLSVAGRHADIVGINMSVPDGNFADAIRRQTKDRVMHQIEWAKAAAKDYGRDVYDMEFQMHIPWVMITDEPEFAYKKIAKEYDIAVEEAVACPLILFGSSSQIVTKLKKLREDTGINYFSFILKDTKLISEFAKTVIEPLRKSM
jgi:probable F420-dependent oxidoreductase